MNEDPSLAAARRALAAAEAARVKSADRFSLSSYAWLRHEDLAALLSGPRRGDARAALILAREYAGPGQGHPDPVVAEYYRASLAHIDAALAPQQAARRPRAPKACPVCGRAGRKLSHAPDPYAAEIHGDMTPVWQCDDCYQSSAHEI